MLQYFMAPYFPLTMALNAWSPKMKNMKADYFSSFSEYSKYFSYLELVLEIYFPKIIPKCAYLGMYLVSVIGEERFSFLKCLQP